MNNKWLSTKYHALKKETAYPSWACLWTSLPGEREFVLLTFMVLTHRVIVGVSNNLLYCIILQYEALLGDFLWQYTNKTELQP